MIYKTGSFGGLRIKKPITTIWDTSTPHYKNIAVGLDGVLRPTPVNMPKEILYRFDGQFYFEEKR